MISFELLSSVLFPDYHAEKKIGRKNINLPKNKQEERRNQLVQTLKQMFSEKKKEREISHE